MKRLALPSTLLLLACSGADGAGDEAAVPAPGPAQAQPRVRSPEPLSLECAVGGDAFARACLVDQARGQEGVTLTIRHPGGGFRRLLVTQEGEVAPADGAEAAESHLLADGRVEVAIGGDRYRIPAPTGFITQRR